MITRIAFVVFCLAAGACASFYGQPFVHDNADVVLIVTTVFTVFAGFLVAIIVILGDPALIPEGDWKIAEGRRDGIENTLIWHNYLFVFYLLTIALVFTSAVVKKAPISEDIKCWIDRAYLFFGVSAFLFSFALPPALQRIQMGRLDREIERRRTVAGIRPDA